MLLLWIIWCFVYNTIICIKWESIIARCYTNWMMVICDVGMTRYSVIFLSFLSKSLTTPALGLKGLLNPVQNFETRLTVRGIHKWRHTMNEPLSEYLGDESAGVGGQRCSEHCSTPVSRMATCSKPFATTFLPGIFTSPINI